MNARTLLLPHPIVFVTDFGNTNVEIPPHSPTSVTSANESCVSVNALADVDGEVTIILANHLEAAPTEQLKLVFEGTVATPGRKIAVVTSENVNLLETEVTGTQSAIEIFVDDQAFPSKIVVNVVSRDPTVAA